MTQQPAKRIPQWLRIDLLVIVVSLAIIGIYIAIIEQVSKILKAVLPHRSQFIDDREMGAYHYLLDEIESSLLGELRNILEGKVADQAAAVRAKEIMDAVKAVKEDQDRDAVAAIESGE